MSWTWCPLCLSRTGFLVTSITFTTWCSLAVTIHCATIAGSMWLCTQELNWNHATFFNILLEWSVPLAENSLANDNYTKDNRCQQSSLWRRSGLSQFSWSWIFFIIFFSNSTPLFFWRPYTVFLWLSAVVLSFVFFFQEKSILPI